ncbi:GDP-mannose 4,6-dehydratase [Nocardioides nematodiphilus]|uniref:GDP-mannose 4,6-dehydratase n=1 Tax=Nocardioides nematodiphilus TaxID=2849669 RepID=UPI001CD98553|nr:GDP-mannose 4,6-dehydratase [Nocardioides nematodiphilus]MCA1983448.1 GDP-mannose 4,6-dehydratase [Nocardioides nematodiphilus]
MTKRALITGITGQDGSYLAELLLEKGYEVHGLVRRSSSFNRGRIDPIYLDPANQGRLTLHYGDMTDSTSLINVVRESRPDEVYNLAAQSHVAVSFEMPEYTASADAMGAIRLLEALRQNAPEARFYQASTSEMFGLTPPPQHEDTHFHPRSPYGAAKLHAHWATINYREAYDLYAVSGILFNHESPRRGESFVTRKITRAVAAITAGRATSVTLGNLDAVRDWGYAKEYVEGMWRMLQQDVPGDYVLATGVGTTVRDFAEMAFSHVGLDWREHVETDARFERPSEVPELLGDASRAAAELGWKATTTVRQLAGLMVDTDIALLQG